MELKSGFRSQAIALQGDPKGMPFFTVGSAKVKQKRCSHLYNPKNLYMKQRHHLFFSAGLWGRRGVVVMGNAVETVRVLITLIYKRHN